MSGEDQAEARLRELLRDPRWSLPAGPDPEQRVRRAARAQRRRLAGLAGVAAAAAVIAVAIPAGVGVLGHPAGPAAHRRPATLYIYGSDVGSGANRANVVIPVNTATGTPGKSIHVGFSPDAFHGQIVITPDGKTAYVITTTVNGCGPQAEQCTYTVTPISTATNAPGKPIPVGFGPSNFTGGIVITPDGKTAYVTTGSGVTPINTATNTPGKPIHVGNSSTPAIAITP